MPPYIGGKSRTKKDIISAIRKDTNEELLKFIEPFCGGVNVSCEAVKYYETHCSDYNEDLIFLWNSVKNGEFNEMPVVTKEMFDNHKNNQTPLSVERSFALFYNSFMTLYKGSYDTDCSRGLREERFRSIKRAEANIKLIKSFEFKSYKNIECTNCIIYCDPPYVDTQKVYKEKEFNTEEFWKWCKEMKDKGNYVYVSERTCPIEHKLLHEKDISINLSKIRRVVTDKLFKVI